MAKARRYSGYSEEAVILLGKQIKLGRKQRQWSEVECAERAGISRATLQKIEKGNLSCAIGLVFEVAFLTGVPLFQSEPVSMGGKLDRVEDKIRLLPDRIRKRHKEVGDDF
ncbi:helix-turn-helix transcriptional regulator [Endozoicomonas numazuensis]|uniref:XRE family transcriptional regulator n=1 Tax=Endozoicomonas numazuensis TaxID=1137799 RepID=A0A081NGQ6_9GAMM|nr:helix-turn-helix transcriptional regulator [Endozoicomonas numazuensis]KEQ17629.1 XRE family transcriptional regulator [Endozoicomonas numazuensis]